MDMRRLTISVLALALAACTGSDTDTTTTTIASTTTTTTSASSTTTTSAPTTTATIVTTTTTAPLPAAPWSADPVSQDAVPAELVEAWTADPERDGCAALAVTDPGAGTGAEPRIANFGTTAWAVAWDLDSGPGRFPTGEDCEDCGRSAFGVAGTGIVGSDIQSPTRWPTVHEYADGSIAGYGPEGFDPAQDRLLAEIVIAGQRCLYQLWTELGPDHMETLIASLRFVDGLGS